MKYHTIMICLETGLLNLRGSDIPYNPVFFAYAIVTLKNLHVFIDNRKLPDSVRAELVKYVNNIQIHPYEKVQSLLENLVCGYIMDLCSCMIL